MLAFKKTDKPFFVLAILCIVCHQGIAQKNPGENAQQNAVNPVDLIGVIGKMFNKNGPARSDIIIPGVRNTSLLPIIGYGPANGFVIGAAISATNLLGDKKNTQLSSALVSISLTTKDQILLCARSDIYLPGNTWYIPGDVRLLFFAQPTYGLGIYGLDEPLNFNVDGTDVSKPVLQQPMRYNYIRFYETVMKEILPHWYAGIGINIDDHFDIDDQSLKLDTPNVKVTSHYFYSTKYGFNPLHYSTNGLLFKITHDSRDNPINSYKGFYASLGFRVNEKIFGGSQNSTMLYADWRNYIPLQKIKTGYGTGFLGMGAIYHQRKCSLPGPAIHRLGYLWPVGKRICTGALSRYQYGIWRVGIQNADFQKWIIWSCSVYKCYNGEQSDYRAGFIQFTGSGIWARPAN